MIDIKSQEEIHIIHEGGKILAEVLEIVKEKVAAGVTAQELDEIAEKEIRKRGATPSFKGYQKFPATLCVSINNEVVHGIPKASKVLKNSDIVGLDIGLWYKGLCTDLAITAGVGKISKEASKLLSVTKKALQIGIKQAKIGNTTGDIGHAVQQFAESKGFGVVRDLVGHGVGRKVHEEPYVPNYGEPKTGVKLEQGMVIAIEPMLTMGHYDVVLEDDDWTYSTADGSLAAQFEHTIAITKEGPVILTSK